MKYYAGKDLIFDSEESPHSTGWYERDGKVIMKWIDGGPVDMSDKEFFDIISNSKPNKMEQTKANAELKEEENLDKKPDTELVLNRVRFLNNRIQEISKRAENIADELYGPEPRDPDTDTKGEGAMGFFPNLRIEITDVEVSIVELERQIDRIENNL